jgi:ribosome-associated translation inhibitor RaiA
MSEEKTMNWLERFFERIKDADKKNARRFRKGFEDYLDDEQLTPAKTELRKLENRLQEKREALDDYVLEVDQGRITSSEDRENYYPAFLVGFDRLESQIEELEEDIQNKKNLITSRGRLIKMMK